MIIGCLLFGLGIFGFGALLICIGGYVDNDIVVNIGIAILFTLLFIFVLSLIAGGIYLIRR